MKISNRYKFIPNPKYKKKQPKLEYVWNGITWILREKQEKGRC